MGDFQGEIGILFDEQDGEATGPIQRHNLFKDGLDQQRGDSQ